MTDVNPQASPEASDGSRERRGGRPSAPGGRPPEERAFAAERAADGRTAETLDQNRELGLQFQEEAVQAGQEMIRMGQRAAAQSTEMWRQSLEPLAAWQAEARRWFDHAWGQMTGLGVMRPMQTVRPFAGGAFAALMGAPAADFRETDGAYLLCVEVPGVGPEDVKLNLRAGLLAVSGHKHEERHEDGGAYQISERRYGSFERVFPLPPDVDRNAIDAKLENGVLAIRLPKTGPGAPAAEKSATIKVHG